MNAPIALDLRKSRLYLRSLMLAASEAALLATVFVLAWQRNWPVELPGFDVAGVPFTHYLPTVRLVELFALASVGAYGLAGWPNRERLIHGPHRMFLISLLALCALALASALWAIHQGLAAVHAARVLVWVTFALMLVCGDWSMPRLAAAFLGGLLAHSAVGLLQVALQHFVGLGPRFGELPVRPQDTWASVVFAGPVRFLRAYGLSGHPNVLGGHAAVGLILSFGLLATWPRVWRALIVVAWTIIWMLLLMTFSRSAWLAIVAGGAAGAILLWRGRRWHRRTLVGSFTLAAIAAVVAVGFAVIFRPFLVGRVDAASQPYETFSISERQDMIDVASQLIVTHPLTGVGAANFSNASRGMLGYPLDWVHNVPLLVTSELGLIGLAAFLGMNGSMLAAGWTHWRSRSITLWQALLGGAVVGLSTIMLFDHYLWTAPQGALLWAFVAGRWMAE
ncbi:MAG TPA: O-antigen ligase family protein [Anaerolineae bacterium]|nr:O-antigen ligase family protein [Anaerolineae bacterium]